MKAITQGEYGPAEVLRLTETELPVTGDDEVLVRVRAASVHLGDWHLMTGVPYLTRLFGFGLRRPRARVRGTAFAGTVERVGARVSGLRPGDEVFGTCDGAFAEYARARPAQLAPKPAGLGFEQAAAVPVSAVAALQGLRDSGRLRSGQHVLVVGAAGGVGTYAVQLAKALGAEVTGVCSTTKLELVRSIGADHVIDYTREDFAAGARRYDLVLDTAGGRPLSVLRRALTARGTLVIVGAEQGGRWLQGTDRQLRALLLSPFVGQRLRGLVSTDSRADLVVLTGHIEAGRVTPVIDRTYPLAEVPDAVRHLAGGHARGKVVITV